MDSLTSLSTKQRLFVVSSVVLGTVLLSSALLSPARARRQKEISLPIVKNETKCLQFVSLEKIGPRFVTRMQNTCNRAITAYVMAVCDAPESATDYSIGPDSIEPGKIVEITTPLRAFSDKCTSQAAQPSLTMLAVVFDDRSTEGDYGWAKSILDDRRGHKIQLKRINRLLREAAQWSDRDTPAAIERLRNEISSLPVDEAEPPAVRGGLSAAKQRVLFFLAELEQWHQSTMRSASEGIQLRAEFAGVTRIQEGIARLASLNEKWISKY